MHIKSFFHKTYRTALYFLTLYITFTSVLSLSKITLTLIDYTFISILIVAFVLLMKFNIKVEECYVDFNDYILIICYFKFNIAINIILIILSNLISFIIDYKYSKNSNINKANKYIFNSSLIISSMYFSKISLNLINSHLLFNDYTMISILLFSCFLLVYNYILYCIDITLETRKIFILGVSQGVYSILLSFLLCLVLSLFSLYLSEIINYIPIIIIIVFILLTSFGVNSITTLKQTNRNLQYITDFSKSLMSKGDFKTKLSDSIITIKKIIPFSYCGMYLFRENYEAIYPICYSSSTINNIEALKFINEKDNILHELLQGYKPIYNSDTSFIEKIKIKHLNTLNATIIIPINNKEKIYGFILIGLDSSINLHDEFNSLSIIGNEIALIYQNTLNIINNNVLLINNYNELSTHIEYNIQEKIFFTLALVEILDYKKIVKTYNLEFYERLKKEVVKNLYKFLSPQDAVLYFKGEDIFIVFDMLDIKNAEMKLKEISIYLSDFKYNTINVNCNIIYSIGESPLEAITKEEILDTVYRKLYNKKNT